mmetsp:Transcript_47220/g.109222  ORF Transcript_47220/g.109222 Transcript_47220/m.109222 type:complete len:532 (+) Transcript_47220:367-1962(+)
MLVSCRAARMSYWTSAATRAHTNQPTSNVVKLVRWNRSHPLPSQAMAASTSIGSAAAVAHRSPQQVLRLFADVRLAFVNGDRARLCRVSEVLLQHVRILRPTEVAVVLNHLAHARVLESHLWQRLSDALPDLFVDPDCKSLGLAVNAYARALLKHEAAIEAITASVLRLASQSSLEGRNIAMLINGLSKLRVRNVALMDTLAERLVTCAADLNEVDLATVANGYGRLTLPNGHLFDALQAPMQKTIQQFSTQNLATIADAHARIQRRDVGLLEAVAAELRRRCSQGTPIPARFLPSLVRAFAVRLEVCPQHFVEVVELSLPQVVGEMDTPSVVLTIPSLVHIVGLRAPLSFCQPVFDHCLPMLILGQLTCKAVVGILDAAARLRHRHPTFWVDSLRTCGNSIRRGLWEGKHIGTLSLLVSSVCAASAWPSFPAEEVIGFFQSVAEGSRVTLDTFDLQSFADLAVACKVAGVHTTTHFCFLHAHAVSLLDAQRPEWTRTALKYHTERLLAALQPMSAELSGQLCTPADAACV